MSLCARLQATTRAKTACATPALVCPAAVSATYVRLSQCMWQIIWLPVCAHSDYALMQQFANAERQQALQHAVCPADTQQHRHAASEAVSMRNSCCERAQQTQCNRAQRFVDGSVRTSNVCKSAYAAHSNALATRSNTDSAAIDVHHNSSGSVSKSHDTLQ